MRLRACEVDKKIREAKPHQKPLHRGRTKRARKRRQDCFYRLWWRWLLDVVATFCREQRCPLPMLRLSWLQCGRNRSC